MSLSSMNRRLSKLEDRAGAAKDNGELIRAKIHEALKHPELIDELERLAVEEDSWDIAAMPPEKLKALYDLRQKICRQLDELTEASDQVRQARGLPPLPKN